MGLDVPMLSLVLSTTVCIFISQRCGTCQALRAGLKLKKWKVQVKQIRRSKVRLQKLSLDGWSVDRVSKSVSFTALLRFDVP